MPRQLLGFLLAVIAFVAIGFAWAETFAPAVQSRFGMTLAPSGANAVVVKVAAPSQAAQIGVQEGDIVDLSRLTYSERMRLIMRVSPPGTAIDLSVLRGGRRLSLTVRAVDLHRPPSFAQASFLVSATIWLVIVAAIAWRRPSLATAALVYVGTGTLTTANVCGLFAALPDPLYGFACFAINTLFASAPELALLPFLVRFPNVPRERNARIRMHLADAIFIGGIIVYAFQTIYEPGLFSSWSAFDTWAPWIQAAVILVFVSLVYSDAIGEERRRIAWVMVGIIVGDIGFALFSVVDGFVVTGSGSAVTTFLLPTSAILQLATPLALGYAILRYRVIDTGFVLNRTAVYAATTTFILTMVGFVDWLAGRFLSGQRFAVALEAVVTIAFGFGLNAIHKRMEGFIDRLIFRRRHLAEKRVESRTQALSFAESRASVDEALVNDVVEILGLSSAAVFTRAPTSSSFRLALATGWQPEDVTEIAMDSVLVRSLRAHERPIFLDDLSIALAGAPRGVQRPILAIPLAAAHELAGIVLYGNGRDGASLDPEEVSMLARIAAAAASAYGVVEALQLRQRAAELEETLRALRPADANIA